MLHFSRAALNWKSRLCFFSLFSCSFTFCFICFFLFFVYCQNVVVHLFHVDFGFYLIFLFVHLDFGVHFSLTVLFISLLIWILVFIFSPPAR